MKTDILESIQSNENNDFKKFESKIDQFMGFGRYQKTVVGLLSLIFIADGIEMSTLSLILPILKKEWDISESLQGMLGSVLFMGLFFGSLIAGFLTDKLGRKKTLEYVSIIQFLLGIYSSTLTNAYIFLLVRGMFGFLLGFIVPLVPTVCTETFSGEKRGKMIVIVNCSFSIGQLFSTIIAWFCLTNMTSGNWRLMLLICSFPSIIVYLGTRRFLKESPRYLILTKDLEVGIKTINEIIDINNDDVSYLRRVFCLDFFKELVVERDSLGYKNLEYLNNDKDLENLKKWRDYILAHHGETDEEENLNENLMAKLKDIQKEEFCLGIYDEKIEKKSEKLIKKKSFKEDHEQDFNKKNKFFDKKYSFKTPKSKFQNYLSSVKTLFNKKYEMFTIGLWLTWFSINFTSYGLVFIIPFFLNSWDIQNKGNGVKMDGLKSLFLTTLGEGLAGIFAYFMVDSKLGRKHSLLLSQFICSMFILMAYFIPLEYGGYLIISLALARLFGKVCFAIIYSLTSEIYHTSIRTLGIGASSAVGRISACIMPIISIKLFYINMWLPFLLFYFVGILGCFGTYLIPYDTYGKNLDVHN